MFVGGDGWDSANLIEGAGAELEGAYFTNHYAPDVPWPNSKKFLASVPGEVQARALEPRAQGYDADAPPASTRSGARPRSTPDAIRKALAETKDFQGATGTMTMDKDRNANKPIVDRADQEQEVHVRHVKSWRSERAEPSREPMKILEALVTGLTQGAMIALVALGYTMVYGVLKLINFAHSEVFMMARVRRARSSSRRSRRHRARPARRRRRRDAARDGRRGAARHRSSSASRTGRSAARGKRRALAHHAARHRARHVGAPPEPRAAALHRAFSAVSAAHDRQRDLAGHRHAEHVARRHPRRDGRS